MDGSVISSSSVKAAHVDAAADILAMLHRFAGIGAEQLPRQRRLGSLIATTQRQLEELAGTRTISRREASAFARIVDDLPSSAMWGVIHTDFGGDNLVVRADDTVVSIDNEHLVRGFVDFDLARSWYRWPMPAPSWRRFTRHYQGAADRDVSADALRPWRVVASMTGVRRRHKLGVPIDVALATLRGVLDE